MCYCYTRFPPKVILTNLSNTTETPLAIYTDEVDPGAALAHVHRRKSQVAYFSFLELGLHALSNEDAWFIMTAQKSVNTKQIQGGLSAALGALLHHMFTGATNMDQSGFRLDVGGQAVRMYARVRLWLQDGAAHKSTWHCKGDQGSRMCMLCKNVVAAASALVDEDGTNLLRANVLYSGETVPADDASIRATVRELEREFARLGDVEPFRDMQQARGFTHVPGSMLLDRALDPYVRPSSDFMHDWMHCLVVGGVFNTCGYLLFESMHTAVNGMLVHEPYTLFEGFLAHFNWPKRVSGSTQLSKIFSRDRVASHRAAKHLKLQASDSLSIYPVLALFVQTVVLPSGQCDAACNAFLALIDVMDFITAVPRGNIDPDMIAAAVHRFLEQFVAVWGHDYTHPKFHWLLHFASHLIAFNGILLSCFVHERRHRLIRRYADDTYNTVDYERTLISEAVCHHLGNLEGSTTFDFSIGLVPPVRSAPKRARNAVLKALDLQDIGDELIINTAIESRFSALATCKKRDVVLISDVSALGFIAGEVWAHLEVSGEPITVVSMWELVTINHDAAYAEWRAINDPWFIDTSEILDTVIWDRPRAGIVRTLLPCHFRG